MNAVRRTGTLVLGFLLFPSGVIWALGGHGTRPWRKMPSRLDAPTLPAPPVAEGGRA